MAKKTPTADKKAKETPVQQVLPDAEVFPPTTAQPEAEVKPPKAKREPKPADMWLNRDNDLKAFRQAVRDLTTTDGGFDHMSIHAEDDEAAIHDAEITIAKDESFSFAPAGGEAKTGLERKALYTEVHAWLDSIYPEAEAEGDEDAEPEDDDAESDEEGEDVEDEEGELEEA